MELGLEIWVQDEGGRACKMGSATNEEVRRMSGRNMKMESKGFASCLCLTNYKQALLSVMVKVADKSLVEATEKGPLRSNCY
jgi:hypothetical protein